MKTKLSHNKPKENGYFIIKSSPEGKPHLVLVIINDDKIHIYDEKNREFLMGEIPDFFLYSEKLDFS